jgi:hypothetical protein
MRILVCGGRDFTDTELIYNTLDKLDKQILIDIVIEGDARGVDRIAGYWARKNHKKNIKYRADWAAFGKRAGFLRNIQMLEEGRPDIVVAFPGGRGTAHMVSIVPDNIQLIEIGRYLYKDKETS